MVQRMPPTCLLNLINSLLWKTSDRPWPLYQWAKNTFVNISGNCYSYKGFIVLNLFTWFVVERPNIKPLLFPLKKVCNPAIFKFSVPQSPRIVTAFPENENKYLITKKAKHTPDDCVLADVSFFCHYSRVNFVFYYRV